MTIRRRPSGTTRRPPPGGRPKSFGPLCRSRLQRQMRAAVERKELVHKAGQAAKASQQKTAVISSAVGRDRRGSLTSRPAGRANLQVVSYYVNYSKICVLYSL